MGQIQKPGSAQQGRGAPPGGPSGGGGGGGPKILRIGVIQSGKIVEERLVRKRENVTVGQSAKNTFVVPASNTLPRSFVLFEIRPQGYAMNFTEGMDGRIAFDVNTTPVTLAQLRGKEQKHGEMYHTLLNDRSRGKIVIGDVTILFQFVSPPPVQPRPQLPPSVRGSITQDLDWLMIGIVAFSFVTHIGFVIYLRNVDWPRKPDIEEIPDRFVQMIVPKKPEEKKVEKVDPNANKLADSKADKKKGDGDKKKPAAVRDPEAEARAAAKAADERRAKMTKDVASMGVLKILGARGEDGTIADLVKGGDPGGDADKVFAQVGGVGVAGAGEGGGLRSRGAGGTGSMRGGGGIRAAGPGEVGTGDKGAEKVVIMRGSVKDSAPVDIDGSLDPNVVANTIRSRKGAIIACYEKALKRNPSLAGKIQLHFTISSIGKVTGADIESNSLGDDEVGSCM
ncbi:MAG: AgmX/PglI C-terminal domain-containing protein, partial [Myxococcales bacterium]|nr:AgmX/PglI C-terminal domain-containing protein [Myxococcales bacterium]